MSPIGRVFIVLNLALAAGFAITGGQLLQNQHNYKQQLADEKEARTKEVATLNNLVQNLEQERGNVENAKTQFETRLLDAEKNLERARDENKRLAELTSQQAADIRGMKTTLESGNTQMRAAFEQSDKAYKASIAAIEAKDAAIKSQSEAEDQAKNLSLEVASLKDAIAKRDESIASLERDNSEMGLLVSAAKAKGFLESMAAPSLAGTVISASGRLCTIKIDNPGSNLSAEIDRSKPRFAIYDASGYKAEVRATEYDEGSNMVLCNVLYTKGDRGIATGDQAKTKL